MTFHCCGAAGLEEQLRARDVRHVTLTGIEAHVCVAQTALELLDRGFRVQVPADAVASRNTTGLGGRPAGGWNAPASSSRPPRPSSSSGPRRPTAPSSRRSAGWSATSCRPRRRPTRPPPSTERHRRNPAVTTAAAKPLEPSPRVLLGPGPSNVPPRVLAALGMPLVGHLDPEFVALMDEMQGLLRQVFRTENPLTLAVSGTGSAGMEAVVVNLIEPGDRMLVCVNGVFGGRMVDVATRAGAEVIPDRPPLGRGLRPRRRSRTAVKQVRPKLVGIVHAETSTGALQPVDEIARIAHDNGALLAIDTVTSLGRRAGRDRRLGDRRRLFGHPEVPELPAGPGPRLVRPPGDGGDQGAEDQGPVLVPRHDDDRPLLGLRPLLPPHRADQHELRPARGAGDRRRGGARRPLRPPRPERPGPEGRPEGDGHRLRARRGAPASRSSTA